MSGFRRGLMANAKPNWRNFALDGGSIPMLGDDVAVIATGDWEVCFDFEIFDYTGGSIFLAATNNTDGFTGTPFLNFNVYDPGQKTYSFYVYLPITAWSNVSQYPAWWSSNGNNFLLIARERIETIGKHTFRLSLIGNELTAEMDGYKRTATVTRTGVYRNPETTYAPTINGHIYRLYFKDLTNNRMLLDVPRSYLTK